VALVTAAAALGTGAGAAPARADVFFTFSGVCTDGCTAATGTLDLANGYVPGSPITTENFISFVYRSDTLSLSFSNLEPLQIAGAVAGENESDNLSILALYTTPSASAFSAGPGDPSAWEAARGSMEGGNTFYFTSSSLSSSPAAVPEPGAGALLVTGLLGLGAAWRFQLRSNGGGGGGVRAS
jgi:hypothetical protein